MVGVDDPGGPGNPPCSNWRVCDPGEEPTPQGAYYTTHTGVTIDDLPADARVTYTPATQHITYKGSADIARIEANHWTTGDPLVGRAKRAHLLLNGLPTGLDLTFQFGPSGQTMMADAGDAWIGHLSLDLLNDTSLLSKPSVASNLILHGRDGLMLWDLHGQRRRNQRRPRPVHPAGPGHQPPALRVHGHGSRICQRCKDRTRGGCRPHGRWSRPLRRDPRRQLHQVARDLRRVRQPIPLRGTPHLVRRSATQPRVHDLDVPDPRRHVPSAHQRLGLLGGRKAPGRHQSR